MELKDFDVWVYDTECFKRDWYALFLNPSTGEERSFWTEDGAEMRAFIDEQLKCSNPVFVGFNNKHYDQFVVKAACMGLCAEDVHEVNDRIIVGGESGWGCPLLAGSRWRFPQSDLMDDMQKGTSLKSIEGHLGMSIEESSVPFDIETPLTASQRAETERYCRHDVEATSRLLDIRRDYLETKLHLASMGGIDPTRALGMTDPMLAAAFMGAEAVELDDERDYEFPEALDYSMIPEEVTAFFARIWDESIPDEELFKSKMEHDICGHTVTYGYGGLHGALPRCRREAGKGRTLLIYDVSSL